MSNQAIVQGRNLCSGWPLKAEVDYVDARLTDLTPDTPLTPWELGSCHVKVGAARVRVTNEGVSNTAKRLLADGPVENPRVTFKPGNRLVLDASVPCCGLPLPVRMAYRLDQLDGQRVQLIPDGVTGAGAVALAKLGLDWRQVIKLPAGLPATLARDGGVTIDLAKLGYLEASLSKLETGEGSLTATLGGAPKADIAAQRRSNAANWLALDIQGDLDPGPGSLHDARVVVVDRTPQDKLIMSDVPHQAEARLERGAVLIEPKVLKRAIERAEPLYKVEDIQLEGNTFKVHGTFNAFVKLPTRLAFTFTATPDGQLRMNPGDARVCGFRAGKVISKGDLAKINFLKADGDGYLVDLKALAGLAMPPIGKVEASHGRLMLRPTQQK